MPCGPGSGARFPEFIIRAPRPHRCAERSALPNGLAAALGNRGIRAGWRWGADIINGIVNGIWSCIGAVANAVTDVANTIRSHLHFSVPDEGPLTDFESWMPEFMSGLAEGIEKSRGMVKAAVNSVAADMVVSPQMAVADGGVMTGTGTSGGADLTAGIVAALKDVLGD